MKIIITFALIILISGCASQDGRTLQMFGGQPKRGWLSMSYISSSDKLPHINWDKSALKAQQRCKDWGYHNVITPDPMSAKLSCVYTMHEDRCAKFNHLYFYQCVGHPPIED